MYNSHLTVIVRDYQTKFGDFLIAVYHMFPSAWGIRETIFRAIFLNISGALAKMAHRGQKYYFRGVHFGANALRAF